MRNRLEVYHAQTEPLIAYYEERGLLRAENDAIMIGVGTALNTTAVAVNTTTAAADKSRAAVKAVKMAATVPTKGAMLVASAGTAVVRKITGNGGKVGNKTGTTVASAVSGSTSTQAGGGTAPANAAARVPGSNSPSSGTGGPTNKGGTPT